MRLTTAGLFMILATSSCTNNTTPEHVNLMVNVIDEDGQPVNGALVRIDGNTTGKTEKQGQFLSKLEGPEGRSVRVETECPKEFEASKPDQSNLLVRFFRTLDGSSLAPIKATFKCVDSKKQMVLLIRADGQSGLPVKALGHEIAKTDADGVAQALLEASIGDEIEIVIDTTVKPNIRPSMPSRRITVPAASQIFVFNQKFEETKKSTGKKRRKLKRSMPRRL